VVFAAGELLVPVLDRTTARLDVGAALQASLASRFTEPVAEAFLVRNDDLAAMRFEKIL